MRFFLEKWERPFVLFYYLSKLFATYYGSRYTHLNWNRMDPHFLGNMIALKVLRVGEVFFRHTLHQMISVINRETTSIHK